MATRERTVAEQHLEQPYEIALVRRDGEGGGEWVAQIVELPGCEARAKTEDEALAAVRLAMVAWIQEALDNKRPVPPPRAVAVHSGRLLVRMPPSLHSDLARVADREKVSLNTLIVGILGGAIAWRQPGEPGSSGDRAADGRAHQSDPGSTGRTPPDDPSTPDRGRLLSVALTANLVVVVVAGLLAIGLLVAGLTT